MGEETSGPEWKSFVEWLGHLATSGNDVVDSEVETWNASLIAALSAQTLVVLRKLEMAEEDLVHKLGLLKQAVERGEDLAGTVHEIPSMAALAGRVDVMAARRDSLLESLDALLSDLRACGLEFDAAKLVEGS